MALPSIAVLLCTKTLRNLVASDFHLGERKRGSAAVDGTAVAQTALKPTVMMFLTHKILFQL